MYIEYFSLVSFIILQSKPAIGLFISANLIINCSFYGLTTQVVPTGTEHLTGQMIKHSLLQIAKGHWKPNQLLPWSTIECLRTSIDGKLTSFLLYSISRLLPKVGGYKENYSIAQRGQLLTSQQLPDPQAGISQTYQHSYSRWTWMN